ncbi:hypothetical protein GCM10009127_28190 [Alteraurantiacibacter aestuarii]|uniref:Lysozyme n=1 Tax=Alteraurantiacibacter aestuarii TaxID=650004 RepID=A0A844ZTN0_9SPHN|nr:lysozyme [Alteraurantiacibacter aestuarii]MXO88929.1 glycoside hydrolase family protein [Alteraurantiacibacter aestuarii]
MLRKPVFDTLRRMLGRELRHQEVRQTGRTDGRAHDQTADPALADEAPCEDLAPRRIGPAGTELIRQFEGCARRRADGLIEAYPDPGTGGDPWTIGWGATGPGIGPGTVWTRAECDARLDADLARYGAEVAFAIGDAPTTQLQFDALVSFHYNTGAIGKATLTRKHVAGDHAGAAREFDRWCYAGGRVMKGLVRRREAESALYRRG